MDLSASRLEMRPKDLPVLSPAETWVMTPSMIDAFLRCPRQYFYRSLLGLKSTSKSVVQIQGILIHSGLEAFNRQTDMVATPETFLQFSTAFVSALSSGELSDPKCLADYQALPALQQRQIQRHLTDTFQAFAQSPSFESGFSRRWVEAQLTLSDMPDLPGLTLQGRADLIRETPAGRFEIVDYKTTEQRYLSTRGETNLKPIMNALEPIDWTLTKDKTHYQDRDYQLPLYWLMAQDDPRFAGHPIDIVLQLVRPVLPNNPETACHTLRIPHDMLMKAQPHLLEFLKQGILERLQEMTHFQPLGDPQKDCKRCDYAMLCEGPSDGFEASD